MVDFPQNISGFFAFCTNQQLDAVDLGSIIVILFLYMHLILYIILNPFIHVAKMINFGFGEGEGRDFKSDFGKACTQ